MTTLLSSNRIKLESEVKHWSRSAYAGRGGGKKMHCDLLGLGQIKTLIGVIQTLMQTILMVHMVKYC